MVALATALIAAGGADALAAVEARQQEIFDRIAPSVVFITAEGGFGSGFFVAADGLVLTNRHVVGKVPEVSVILHDGRTVAGQVVERAANEIDLALVRVPVENVPALSLEVPGDLRIGSWVASVGHARGGAWAFNVGLVSNIYPVGSDRPVFQTQIPLAPGSSGGPVVDKGGRVVGIVTAGIEGAGAINFAIRSDVALRTLQGLASLCACIVIEAPAGTPVFVDGRMAGVGPRVVIAAAARSYEISAVVAGQMKREKVRFPEQRSVRLQ